MSSKPNTGRNSIRKRKKIENEKEEENEINDIFNNNNNKNVHTFSFLDELSDGKKGDIVEQIKKRKENENNNNNSTNDGKEISHWREEDPEIVTGEGRYIKEIELCDGAKLYNFYLSEEELGTLHADMKADRPDEYEYFTFMGKRTKHPRKMCAYLHSYEFSGKRHTSVSQEENPLSLLRVMELIQNMCCERKVMQGVTFNSALVNWYADGHEYIAKHSDDERDLVAPATVATLSLGQERVLRVRRKSDNAIVKDVKLKHGSVYIMHGPRFQADFTHEVPKVGGKKGEDMAERISVTLRNHKDN